MDNPPESDSERVSTPSGPNMDQPPSLDRVPSLNRQHSDLNQVQMEQQAPPLHTSPNQVQAMASAERASVASSRTSHSSVKKRAAAEAARMRLKFAEQEANLRKKQVNLEIELDVLRQRKELAALEAEVEFLERSSVKSEIHDLHDLPNANPVEETQKYVDSLQTHMHQFSVPSNDAQIAQYLYKKDIFKDRLYSFNGKFEHYLAWKDTFKGIMNETQAAPSEEVDLMIRWAGPGSRYILSIKTANTGNPAVGLTRAWDRLDALYGSPERIEQALRAKLNNVTRLTMKDREKMYDLSDVLSEIRAVKEKKEFENLLAHYDSPSSVNPIVNKLPPSIQNKWRDRAVTYKRSNNVTFPPFTFFCEFVQEMAAIFNDPSFDFEPVNTKVEPQVKGPRQLLVNKTESVSVNDNTSLPCFLHNGKHSLGECRAFKQKTFTERRQLLKQQGICFKCCIGKHLQKDCIQTVQCNECRSSTHATAMHLFQADRERHGGEKYHESLAQNKTSQETSIVSRCTEVCGEFDGKSCSKIVLVNVRNNESNVPPVQCYAIIDDQSNYSLAKPELFDKFGIMAPSSQYNLRSCGGTVKLSGRRGSGFVVESLDGSESINLPILTECEFIPGDKTEIPTPSVARSFQHLNCLVNSIPPFNSNAGIWILLGRDVLSAHHVLEQKLGPEGQPFAQQLRLGWVIVGESCIDRAHTPKSINVLKTHLLTNGRTSLMESCPNSLNIDLFLTTEFDNKLGLSVEDKKFNTLMSQEMKRNNEGNWEAPLPFKSPRPNLLNNKQYATGRTSNFISSLHKDPVKKEHTLNFMQELLDNGHAERVTSVASLNESWYLPLFGVYHPKKKDRIRIVFDSSARFQGLSLNDILMTGPNLNNSLLGVLLRFRKDKVAVIADIRQMFYSFSVRPDHRDFLRFVWPENNDLKNNLVDYRMKVHVFGNSPSPSVATYGLRKTAEAAAPTLGADVEDFVKRNFYVDDGLSSHASAEEAIDLLKRAQTALHDFGNLHLHKICSNSHEVLSAFNKDDLAKDLKDLDLDDDFPLQRSLGVCWNVQLDTFTFNVSFGEDNFTRRSVLSTINSLYDPLGIAAPVTVDGKLLLRESSIENMDWDEPLRPDFKERWQAWKSSLDWLKDIQLPRMYCDVASSDVRNRDLFIYCDASEKAIAAVAYLVTEDKVGRQHVGFVHGKAKVAPKHGHTIPRLELCAAVLAVELLETCQEELDFKFKNVKFFTDSKVVLGYIHNEKKRFYVYVSNRIDRIRSSTSPDQWNYVPTKNNPADDATRGVSAENLTTSKWIKGPNITNMENFIDNQIVFPLVHPETDCEVRVLKTETCEGKSLRCERFERFSSWNAVVRGVAYLVNSLKSRQGLKNDQVNDQEQARHLVIKALQQEKFPEEIQSLKGNTVLPRNSPIRSLAPYLDGDGIVRVGGRLKNANVTRDFANPIIVPKHHLSKLLVEHYHERTQHQGRHLTEGAIRSAGYWLLGSKRQVSSYIHNCVKCRRLRSQPVNPRMADLPEDRLDPAPPFTYIGIDVFGPWQVSTRRTRGGQANSKRWALIITCLVVRAVHIELMEEISSSSFINALRRFCAIRGEVKVIRSDRGTNFVGSTSDLKANVINVEDRPIKDYFKNSGINWIFNPPHSSHMGGAWERMIGIARRILDSMLFDVKHLTHEVLQTLMAEVMCIINARPLTQVSTDPDLPLPLTPATLLTMKSDHSVKSFNLEDFSQNDLFRAQWKRVQHLANSFWLRWKRDYLPNLQRRQKWQDDQRNLKTGDIVLLRDKTVHRNEWPVGIVKNTHNGEDGRVRVVDVYLGRDRKIYTRPVKEIVSLIQND